jgi:DNA repair exonuclease SbcCD ATPase subunit
MIIFEYIKYKNLLSSGNYWTEFKLNSNQNTLIVGANGAGKSTVLDALCFVLFGKAFRNINKPSLVNSINKKDCLVEIGFTTNNKKYRVIRGIKPNVFQIFQDGVMIDQEAAMKDYQEILEKSILKFNYKSFTQIVILGSASFVPFMQLSTSDRRVIIEDLLDIHIFSTMNTILKDRVSNNKDLIAEKKASMTLLRQKYDIEKKHFESIKQDNTEKIKRHEDDIDNCLNNITRLNDEITELHKLTEGLKECVQGKSVIDENITKLNRIEAAIENKLSKKVQDVNFFKSNDECPTCRQVIDSGFKENEITKVNTEIDELKVGIGKLKIKLKEEQNRLHAINEKQKELQKILINIATHNTTITETNRYIRNINREIEQLKTNINVTSGDENLLKGIKNNILEIEGELQKLLEEKVYYEVSQSLLKDNGIKTKIIKQYLPIINKLVNKYLTALDFFVNFNLDESFKETIKSRHRDEFTYHNFSEGEKTKINLALLFAWREIAKIKNSANTNLLILDEIFDSSLDNTGIDYLTSILHTMEEINIHVISHKGEALEGKFDKILKFEKIKSFARVKTI